MTACTVTILPHGIIKTCDSGTTVLDVLTDAGLHVKSPCGGRGTCGKCLVKAEGALLPSEGTENQFIQDRPGMRLACLARIAGDTVIHIPPRRKSPAIKKSAPDPSSLFAAAVDLGTTTIQISLVDLKNGASYALDSFLNPQRRYGHDVIARIAASRDHDKRRELVRLIGESLERSLMDSAGDLAIPLSSITKLVFAGNTIMTYLLLDLDPAPLGTFPYTAAVRDFKNISAGKLFPGKSFNPEIHALPAVSAYLGGDLLGGLTILDRMGLDRNTFFFDMGTNGEMFLRNGGDNIYAASCAMGPALEGMNISSGMTAEEGGINHVRLKDGTVDFDVMGGGEPAGITGTGVIDIIAILLRSGMLKDSGAFDKKSLALSPLKNLHTAEDEASVILHQHAALTQKDIRAVQLAKGASLAAARLLLREARYDACSIRNVIIAGSFGENLDLDNFRRLAFLPDFPGARYHFFGNTSLKAAEQACLDDTFIMRATDLRKRIHVIELSDHPLFHETFMTSLDFSVAD